MYKISVIPGDGIGKEVMEATLHVLEALELNLIIHSLMQVMNTWRKLGWHYPRKQ